jgi:hypothetical protein
MLPMVTWRRVWSAAARVPASPMPAATLASHHRWLGTVMNLLAFR